MNRGTQCYWISKFELRRNYVQFQKYYNFFLQTALLISQMEWLGIFLSQFVLNSYAVTGIRTHISRVGPDWDLEGSSTDWSTRPWRDTRRSDSRKIEIMSLTIEIKLT